MNTCLIPLRSSSKRFKDKNVIDFNGIPIFNYPLETAIKSKLFDKIILAMDEEYYYMPCIDVGLALEYSMNNVIKYKREKENSKDSSTLYDLVDEVVAKFELTGNMCILYSTSVLTTINQLRSGFKLLNKFDCVFPIVKTKYEIIYINNVAYKQYGITNNSAQHADAWFWFKIKPILKNGKKNRQIIQVKNGYIELKDYEAHPVHTKEDIKDLTIKYNIRINYE